uniref:Uncharacterized protein n=1 Tax=Arundo donax TaxID=35708 RepID=A0A0A9E9X5_ARUDO
MRGFPRSTSIATATSAALPLPSPTQGSIWPREGGRRGSLRSTFAVMRHLSRLASPRPCGIPAAATRIPVPARCCCGVWRSGGERKEKGEPVRV